MILNLINEYFKEKIQQLNSDYALSIQMKQIESDNDISKIPMNEKFINYQLFITEVSNEISQSIVDSRISVKVLFYFSAVNKNFKTYEKIFSNYLWNLYRILRADSLTQIEIRDNDNISYSLIINDLEDIKIIETDNFENNQYKPSIVFDLLITDSKINKTGVQS